MLCYDCPGYLVTPGNGKLFALSVIDRGSFYGCVRLGRFVRFKLSRCVRLGAYQLSHYNRDVTIVYWCGTHEANENRSEWDDSFPPLSSCDLKYLFSRITCIVDIITNKLSTRIRNCDHMLNTVVHMCRTTVVRGRNYYCDPSVRVTVRGAWVLYIPPSNLFPHIVFDGGGRSRRSVRSNRERAMSIASMSCVSQYLGRRLHPLLFLANTANTFIRTSTHSVMTGLAIGRLPMCVMRLITVHRNVMSSVCSRWLYYPPIT
ncbi:Uncharacterized protein FWK35_00026989 [Aphis craccivora]|uniref:Uncharacterized protein n=1 Tax=Aphis craccivora TaxID=307492 RepID=A0A6G0W5X5_APHCR|nr:Uncharacterized protein FWK35_00026989 [Aphis craccivora]